MELQAESDLNTGQVRSSYELGSVLKDDNKTRVGEDLLDVLRGSSSAGSVSEAQRTVRFDAGKDQSMVVVDGVVDEIDRVGFVVTSVFPSVLPAPFVVLPSLVVAPPSSLYVLQLSLLPPLVCVASEREQPLNSPPLVVQQASFEGLVGEFEGSVPLRLVQPVQLFFAWELLT